MAQPENPYRAVIEEAGGPFLVEKDAWGSRRVAPELFAYLQRCRDRFHATHTLVPAWLNIVNGSLRGLLDDPERLAHAATNYAAARKQGFVMEPEDPSQTPCGKPAAQVFDKLVADAVERFRASKDFREPREPFDARYRALYFGFEGPDLRALWSIPEGEDLIDFFTFMRVVLGERLAGESERPLLPVGSRELWRAFLNFKDPLRPADATAAATTPEEAPLWPEWVTAEDRWERLAALNDQFKRYNISDSESPIRWLFNNPDELDFLMGFNLKQLQSFLPHLIEQARLSALNLRLAGESTSALVHPRTLSVVAESVHGMSTHELVARCWINPEGMDDVDVKAIFGGSIHPNTFSILRTYIGKEDFKQLGVDKIRFADQLLKEQRLIELFGCIGSDVFMRLSLPLLERIADLELSFFEAVVESPAPSEEGPDEADEPVYIKALVRLSQLPDSERTALEDLVLRASQFYARTDHRRHLRDRDLSQGRSPRNQAIELIRAIPVERLAKLPLNHHAALLQCPELVNRLDTLEQIPEEWLALVLNMHLKNLPRLDEERTRENLVNRVTSPDRGTCDDFNAMVDDFPKKIRALLECPDPNVLCDFVESCGSVEAAQAELGMDTEPAEEHVEEAVALMVHREKCRSAHSLRARAAAEPSGRRRRLRVPAYVDLPKNDLWHETPEESHLLTGFEFEDFLRHGCTLEDLATLARQHRFVARLVQFEAEQRQAAEERSAAESRLDDLGNVEL